MQKDSKVEEVKKMEYEIQEVYEGDLDDIEEFEHEDGEIYYNNQGDIYNAEKQRVGALVKGKVVLSKCARFEPELKYARFHTR